MTHTAKFYCENGYLLLKEFFSVDEIGFIKPLIEKHHQLWLEDNETLYKERAINSAYLTNEKYLSETDRLELFQFIASDKLLEVVESLIPKAPAFMNTQCFFDPYNKNQANYWHRDIQYTDIPYAEQKQKIKEVQIIHFRIPLKDEPGIELVPASHINWDTEEEELIRLEKAGHQNSEDLSKALTLKLDVGDCLIFSANMIHRGLYGSDRLSFDIIYCDGKKELLNYVDESCLPKGKLMDKLDRPEVFQNTLDNL